MNQTKHGRWGRYKIIRGVEHKLCNGTLHPEGAWLPLRAFWIMKSGARAGKPMSQCAACNRVYKGRSANSGLVPVDRVYFIFFEIESRIGRTEACRRMNMSANLWSRLDKRIYENMEKATVEKAMVLLAELRANGEVRHRDSISHGAAMRGRTEKKPVRKGDFQRRLGALERELAEDSL